MTELNLAEIPYQSGAVRYRYSRFLSKDGTRWIRHGLFVEYSESGSVIAQGNYANGQEDGLWCSFHENGMKAGEGHYAAGKEEGIWNFWSPTGDPEEPMIYRGGDDVSKE